MTHLHTPRTGERGFTLVELAIVLVIIGLLIGGVLQGRELINSARVTASVAAIRGYDAAAALFMESYGGYPGDFIRATVAIPGCTGNCVDGNGNGNLNASVTAGNAGNEGMQFWIHLSKAGLITTADGTPTLSFGSGLPSSSIGQGGFIAGYWSATSNSVLGQITDPRGGHYLTLLGNPGNWGTGAVSTKDAARLDRKLDDGDPTKGGVGTPNAGCVVGVAGESRWTEANPEIRCSVLIALSL